MSAIENSGLIEAGQAVSRPAETERVFFALWPDSGVCKHLYRISGKMHARCDGRRMRASTLHITLVFLGAVQRERLEALRGLAARIRAPAFRLAISRFGCWRHNRIAWAAPEETPPALMQLVDDLQRALQSAAFQFDAGKPYFPHLTLLRKANCPAEELPLGRVEWPVNDFVLVRSLPTPEGSAYEVIGRWPL